MSCKLTAGADVVLPGVRIHDVELFAFATNEQKVKRESAPSVTRLNQDYGHAADEILLDE
ncbi:MAG: hypothetical protein JOY54_11280 [Acidobacteriaceae bacterium]|nr:hypothetical protein [Acidobacteriaceae bacterium]